LLDIARSARTVPSRHVGFRFIVFMYSCAISVNDLRVACYFVVLEQKYAIQIWKVEHSEELGTGILGDVVSFFFVASFAA
jgi:hypothetical protein